MCVMCDYVFLFVCAYKGAGGIREIFLLAVVTTVSYTILFIVISIILVFNL